MCVYFYIFQYDNISYMLFDIKKFNCKLKSLYMYLINKSRTIYAT
jgi:hypothetical protein